MMPYENELQVALEAVHRAGEAIMADYAHFEVVPDAPASITTATDRRSQEIILQCLQKAFPADGLCAEETTETLAQAVRTGPRLWIVDPIDGTRGFARKLGEFSVMVALWDPDGIAVGVVSEPAHGRLTYAVRGNGCWRQDASETMAQPCRVTHVADLAAATLTQSHSRKPNAPSRQLQALHPMRILETYSAGIKLALVARGEADLYLNTYDSCHDWDICAGQILVEEAGGRVTNLLGQKPQYGLSGAVQHHGLLASNGILHEAALASLRNQ
ncbi:MAG TPA: 3'(2'),5'-bisphosphate nucleotidase CysQ [Gemmataceae bacterium]|nr:3'(2'),5'-bisphosphate nucleotidase CysQ [Gemmataceae bacterium]